MGYLISDGVNDVVSLPAGSTSNVGTTAYTWWIKGTLRAAPSGLAGILGTSSFSTSSGFATNATLQLRVYSAGTNRYGTGDNFFEVGVYHHYRLEHDAGGAWRAYRDNMTTPVASGTFTGSFTFGALNQMFRSSNAATMWTAWDMEEMGITSTTFSETYQANLSGGTGSVLPTVSGNNNGTLVNFPTDGSQWGGFGSTITASANFNMPQMAVAIAGTVTAPVYSAAVSVTMPQMVVSASSTVDVPVFTASASFLMPQMQASSAGNVLSPGVGASVDFTMPQMAVSIDAASAVPAYTAELSVTMPQMSVSAAADVVVSGVSGSVAFSMPQFTVNASGPSAAPTLSASISFSMPQMIVQASTFEADYYAVENIDIPAALTNIELIAASRHIEYTNQSSHLEWRA